MKKIVILIMLLSLILGACSKKVNDSGSKPEKIKVINPVKEKIMTQDLHVYKNEFFVVENGKFGVINLNGELVINPLYNAIYTTLSGEYLGKKDHGYDLIRNYHVVDEFQNTLDILEEDYDSYIFDDAIGLWRVRKDGKRAYVDMTGKQLSETMFERISPAMLPSEGDRMVTSNLFASYEEKNNLYYCTIHALDGSQIIPPISISKMYWDMMYCGELTYKSDWKNARNGRVKVDAYIVDDNGKYDVYLTDGTKLVDDADKATFVWDQDAVRYEKEGQAYSINYDGIISEEIKETVVGSYSIRQKDGYFGVVNADGSLLVPYKYSSIDVHDYASDEYKDYFLTTRNGKKYVVDAEGEELFVYNYSGVSNTRNPKFWYSRNEKGKNQLLSEKGEVLLDEEFEYFSVGYFIIAYTSDGYRVYDQNLKLIFESNQRFHSPFFEDIPYFGVMENGKVIIKDELLNVVGDLLYDYAKVVFYEKDGTKYAKTTKKQVVLDEFDSSRLVYTTIDEETYFFLKMNNQIQFFDNQLNVYYTIDADSINYAGEIVLDDDISYKYFSIEKEGKFAVMLESGEFLTEYKYDEIKFVNYYGYIAVRKENKWGVLNYRGEQVVDFIYDSDTLTYKGSKDGIYNTEYFFVGEWYQTYFTEYRYNYFTR